MTTNRRAEIQRRLSLAPVPKPPAGLADRIKDDIPKELRFDAEKERARLRQGVAFNLRVAASIILLVSSVYLALHLLSRSFAPVEYETAKNADTATAAAVPQLAAAKSEAPAAAAAPATRAATIPIEVCVAPFDPAKNIVRVTAPKAEVTFNDAVVASSRRVSPEVYEIVLRRRVRQDETIATVRALGTEQIIRRADVRPWQKASRDMKSASLTLALDERGAAPDDIAAKARAAGLDDVAAAAESRQHP